MAKSPATPGILRLVAAGATRLVTGFANEAIGRFPTIKNEGLKSALARAVQKIRTEYGALWGGQISYEDARNIYRRAVRGASTAWKSELKQRERIEQGLPPVPVHPPPRNVPDRTYILRVQLVNPNTGASYWSTVYHTGPEGMSITQLEAVAKNAVMSRTQQSRKFRDNNVTQNWDREKVLWVG